MSDSVRYQFEYDERIRCAFIGAGGHSYRNVYPTFQYAPVELVAVCDQVEARAADYARIFGAPHHYADHRQMLADQEPQAVFIVTGYDDEGTVLATQLAIDCLRAGAHVWMEKPTAATSAEVRELMDVSAETGKIVMTGIKKVFSPAIEKVKQVMEDPAFGPVSSIVVRYPEALPPASARNDPVAMRRFLDHVYHPASVLNYLMGPADRMTYERDDSSGGSVTTIRFASGAVGALHLSAGSATTSPLERVDVVGDGANITVENGVRVIYYRNGPAPDIRYAQYGRSSTYLVDDDTAPLIWEPEFSLGQLSNKNLFFLGYVPEVLHFCESVSGGREPDKGTLEDSMAIMRYFDTYRRLPAGVTGPVLADDEADRA